MAFSQEIQLAQWRQCIQTLGPNVGIIRILGSLLRGPWDLVTTYNWAYNPIYNPPKWEYRGCPNYKWGYNASFKWLLSPMGLQVEYVLPFLACQVPFVARRMSVAQFERCCEYAIVTGNHATRHGFKACGLIVPNSKHSIQSLQALKFREICD